MTYEELLKKAMKEIPDEIHEKQRFEIPSIESLIQGNSTMINNFSQICKYLNRSPQHVLKYLLREFATSGSISGTKAIFTGKFGRGMMQSKLELYIKEFVICKECKHADTKLITEDRLMFMQCMACNAKHPVRKIK